MFNQFDQVVWLYIQSVHVLFFSWHGLCFINITNNKILLFLIKGANDEFDDENDDS